MVTVNVGLLLEDKIDAIPREKTDKRRYWTALPENFRNLSAVLGWLLKMLTNFVRGLSPYPAAWAELKILELSRPLVLKNIRNKPEITAHNLETGHCLIRWKKGTKIALTDGYLTLYQHTGTR